MSCTRRAFVKRSFGSCGAWALAGSVPAFVARTAMAAGPARRDDTILIVVQLGGGNDGLNTVVPYEDDRYARGRPTLRLRAGDVLKLDGHLGLHPQATAFKRLLDDGLLGIVQGVGYANPNRNHGGGMRVWQTAHLRPAEIETGWLGRTVDLITPPGSARVPAAFVGQIGLPVGLHAQRAMTPVLHRLGDCTLQPLGPDRAAERQLLRELAQTSRRGDTAPWLEFLRQTTAAALETSDRVAAAAESPAATTDYPAFGLAQRLKTIAQLIRAELGIRIFYTELGGPDPGGFDNHSNQADNHGVLLHELAESLAALARDLKRDKLLDRVLLMTFSEFGRTLSENGRRGTDHGAAAPLFVVGGRVRAGLVGPHPSLDDLDGGAPRFHTDFRRVYATVLDEWLGFDSRDVLGERFDRVAMLGG